MNSCLPTLFRLSLALVFALGSLLPSLLGAAPPRIGYVYPAGGQTESSFEMEIGGQYLGDPIGVLFSGSGVSAEIIEHNKLPSAQVIGDYRDRLRSVRPYLQRLKQGEDVDAGSLLPEIDEILARVSLSEKQVRQIDDYSRRRNDPKRQLNNQIGESVRVRVTIAPDAEPGLHYCRLQTSQGLSNPMRFVVGYLVEAREPAEWNFDLPSYLGLKTKLQTTEDPSVITGPVSLPITINGRILPGEVDEFVFEAKEGDQLVVDVDARSLVPYLADAVPGWFQAVVSLQDPRGRELAFADDYRFDPDPVLFYKIPRDGKYRLRIHDSIYRGREDFVYRITMGELPFLTGIRPLGGQAGTEVDIFFQGGNLVEHERPRFPLPEKPGMVGMWASGAAGVSNSIDFHVDSVPEEMEREENDRIGIANPLEIPSIVNGSIHESGDLDFYRVKGDGNRPITFEIFARRLGSPLDSNLTIFDDDGKQIAWNDDFENPSAGLTTHHADARITIDLPSNGVCFIRVGDTQNQGGIAHAYRLKVTQGEPDVALRVTPSSLLAYPGGNARGTIHALRLDGFQGPIRIELDGEVPKGFKMSPVTIASGETTGTVSIQVPNSLISEPQEIRLRGIPIVDGKDASSLHVVPAEDMTQAFITKHIVPVDALLIDIREAPPKKKTSD
ncbi:MAG: hypothetical protein P1U85_11905 [Verrucomicrobiales bacterium]|nr:hypothetical protein [Verrucomicrobiales bacterium]